MKKGKSRIFLQDKVYATQKYSKGKIKEKVSVLGNPQVIQVVNIKQV